MNNIYNNGHPAVHMWINTCVLVDQDQDLQEQWPHCLPAWIRVLEDNHHHPAKPRSSETCMRHILKIFWPHTILVKTYETGWRWTSLKRPSKHGSWQWQIHATQFSSKNRLYVDNPGEEKQTATESDTQADRQEIWKPGHFFFFCGRSGPGHWPSRPSQKQQQTQQNEGPMLLPYAYTDWLNEWILVCRAREPVQTCNWLSWLPMQAHQQDRYLETPTEHSYYIKFKHKKYIHTLTIEVYSQNKSNVINIQD